MKILKFLFHPTAETGGPSVGGNPNPEPPPAATVVLTGTRSERETNLEAELASERASHATTAREKKDRENRINELEDQLRTVRQEPASPKVKRGMMEAFLAGEDDDDE